jgi:nucleotide-binding universal stress UspA family protein
MKVEHILAGADESEAGRQAVRTAIDLAGRARARVTVVRAVPVGAMAVAATTTGGYDFAEAEIESPAIDDLRQWIGSDLRAQSQPPHVELAIASGIAGLEIRRLAEQREADLVVLGRKRRSQLARLILGDTAGLVARHSRIPCLLVPAESGPLQRMLVAVDGSDQGMLVLAKAASFAQAIGITRLRVLTVEPGLTDQPPAGKSARLGSLEREARGILKHQRVEMVGPSVEVRRGAVIPQIVAAVTETGSDLLAIGYHRGGLPGFIEAGSIGRHLAHTAPCAVLTIPL